LRQTANPSTLRHHHVEQDEVEHPVLEDLERFRAAARTRHVEALLLQDGLLEVQDVLVVVDHKDPLRHRVTSAEPARGRKRIIASARSGFNERRNRGRRLGSADDEAGYWMQKFEVFDVTPSTSA
jgi:hypothetical protein